ncbi:cysteine hydrolase [Amycolatopsis acidiphila]|uniref:Cysteine hydrolase n=1 Tax=Amycolatopsis acidiphila TaxID=715473 RepID=A0A558AB18_9PSEU|nr:cysteine hydrolase [Amycolatopsis acidiphila]TVT21443.1 cysteine hydrolase [Amycolatopsis acidiphila]UIJ63116.1 cysteine hydrolase [Amycolatopsis acidiphila]GHG73816.1 isochorismatase [Amycolatopsis acidiphila]
MPVRGLDRGERAALVINECQNGMVNAEHSDNGGLVGEIARRGVLARIAGLADACREAGMLVVHSTIVLRPDGVGTQASSLLLGALRKRGACVEGKPAAEIHPRLTPRPEDYVSRRLHGLSPFHGTELEAVLREREVRSVIVTGVSTNVGIPGACLEALNRGLTAIVPTDAIAGSSREIHDFQVAHTLPLLATVTTSDEVISALRKERA